MSEPERKRKFLTIMLVPEGGQEARTFRLSYGLLRALAGIASAVALGLTLVAGSWWYLAARASRVSALEQQVKTLQAERGRIQELGRRVQGIEEQYKRIRDLFGANKPDAPSDVWLPPPTGSGRARDDRKGTGTASLPSSWPLTERGYVTQGLLEGQQGEHTGLDIAVPTDSYIRAAGAGTVVDVGKDPVYGRFVIIDHGGGYTSVYGHASLTLV